MVAIMYIREIAVEEGGPLPVRSDLTQKGVVRVGRCRYHTPRNEQ